MFGLLSLVQPQSKGCTIFPGKAALCCCSQVLSIALRVNQSASGTQAAGRPGSISRTISLYSHGYKLVLQSIRQMTKQCGLQERVLSFISDKRKRGKTTRTDEGRRQTPGAQWDALRRLRHRRRARGDCCKKTESSAGRPTPAPEFLGYSI